MSENVKNENVKVVVANLKSPVIGFVLTIFLGGFGIDRFYKGGIISILLGIIKLFGIIGALVVFFAVGVEAGIVYAILYGIVYFLDWFLVPLGIVLDNRAKLKTAQDGQKRFLGKSDLIGFAIVLLLPLSAIIVPRFVATRGDAQVAVARSDMASAQKAIVAKIFADNINPKVAKPTDPNMAWGKGKRLKGGWGEWIISVAGLDSNRWYYENNGVYPIYKDGAKDKLCFNESKLPLLWINTRTGSLHFNPSKLGDGEFCQKLRESYVSDKGNGDRIIPLESTGTIKF
ncbi:hypothetical protein [Helicobacter sp. 23-1045]